MKLHFDSNQEYQLKAIQSVVNVFEGQPLNQGSFEFSMEQSGALLNEFGMANRAGISIEQIEENIKRIQQENAIAEKDVVTELQGMHFSVEMETGTGKTYVYLRTIYELNKQYGFLKFIIVVPSVAIREGVLKNLEITADHFQTLYDRIPVSFDVYDSKRPSTLRGFAGSNSIQILVINIDSFAKDENIINKPNDKLTGKRPIEFIQASHPIVIVDEPQNMETENRKKAIDNLNPLCTLRYSATHTNLYNLLYSLNPVQAYDLGLVKQIEVDSVRTEGHFNEAYLELEGFVARKNSVSAKMKIDVSSAKGVDRKSISMRPGVDLFELSGKREVYADGYIIDEIDAQQQTVTFVNGQTLYKGQTRGGLNDELMKFMIRKTVEEHVKKEVLYKDKGIKVLSLIFIDKVKNYREYDEAGNQVTGKFGKWLEEILKEELKKPKYESLYNFSTESLHDGYFSSDNKGRVKDTGGETQADDDTYNTIMRDKEKLLDNNIPLRFIFSHSALREGWDNPNVFQICTLNETKSELKKRQEIGRGLRLAVNQDGERLYDKSINRLTVIANESYEDFAKALQNEIEEDCGVEFSGRIKNKADRIGVRYRKGFEADPKFLAIWDRIKSKTRYQVNYNSNELITEASDAVRKMTEIHRPLTTSTKARILMTGYGVSTSLVSESMPDWGKVVKYFPDVIAYVQARTELSRTTILDILRKSGRLNDMLVNPQMFMDNVVSAIKPVLSELMMDGIVYHQLNGCIYEMHLFDDFPVSVYYSESEKDVVNHFKVTNPDKTIYENLIPLDSTIESRFAADCESSEEVDFYFKLPTWFKIPTPIGGYNPDWAVVLKNESHIYFVAETKQKGQELRISEKKKMQCGQKHYELFEEVIYKRVEKLIELKGYDC